MKSTQIKLLTDFAKEIKSEKKNKAKVRATLQSARILTKEENFTRNFSNLNRVTTSSK